MTATTTNPARPGKVLRDTRKAAGKLKLTEYERAIRFIEKAQEVIGTGQLVDDLEEVRGKLGNAMRARIDEIAPAFFSKEG